MASSRGFLGRETRSPGSSIAVGIGNLRPGKPSPGRGQRMRRWLTKTHPLVVDLSQALNPFSRFSSDYPLSPLDPKLLAALAFALGECCLRR